MNVPHHHMRIIRKKEAVMPNLTRRGFIAATLAAGTARHLPQIVRTKPRVVLELVYDKGLGMMRAVERVIR